MALDQYFPHELKSISSVVADLENSSGCFDCNICLDFANNPVVTLCGHLYCWPCIYNWLHFQNASLDSSPEHPQCPVCKAEISQSTVVPLYGNGKTSPQVEPEDKKSYPGISIPPRPPAIGTQVLTNRSYPPDHRLPYNSSYQNQQDISDNSSSTTMMGDCHGMFGEMVYARVFGNSQSLYIYPNSYHSVPNSSPRLRRQHMLADKCMNRLSTFLFCCLFLCLLLF